MTFPHIVAQPTPPPPDTLICTNLHVHYLRVLLQKLITVFLTNLFLGRFFKKCQKSFNSSKLSILERNVVLNFNKHKFPYNVLCKDWLKLAQWFWISSQKCKSLLSQDKMWPEKLHWAWAKQLFILYANVENLQTIGDWKKYIWSAKIHTVF